MVTIPWRIGVNMREFAYYERPECRRFPATPPTREAQIAGLRKLGIPLVRFFAVNRNLNFDENAKQVGLALDTLKQNNMQAIVCLADSLWDAGYTVPGDDNYHRGTPLGHLNKTYWHDPGYTNNFLPYVRQLVARYADHAAVLAWELGNEYAIHPQPATTDDFKVFYQFAQTASEEIKQLSPNKLISTGLINTNQVVPGSDLDTRRTNARMLYSLPSIDLISIHVYAEQEDDWLAMIDANVAINDVQKPFFIGELSADVTKMPNRAPFIQQKMTLWKQRGVCAALLWAYDDSLNDTGVADTFGFARRHGDYGSIIRVVTSMGGATQPVDIGGMNTSDSATSSTQPAADTTTQPIAGTATQPVAETPTIQPVGPRNTAAQPPPFTLIYPMIWPFTVLANFNDDVTYSNSPNKLQKREGILFAPQTLDQPLEVRAVQRGRVTMIRSYPPGYGNYVCITHDWYGDTYVTWYCQLDSISVAVGQHVNQGDVIGIAGQSGSASQVCLFLVLQHIGKGLANYVVDDVVDPLPYLTTAPTILHNEATYLSDATFPDGSILLPGERFKKLWQIRNTGTTSWGDGYQLAFFSDEAIGTVKSVPLPTTRPGDITVVGVDMVAPTTPGIHRTTWKPRAPDGTFFSCELYALIDVRASGSDLGKLQLSFVADVTIPDRTIVAPGTAFTKTWTVRNTGNRAWDSTYQLVFVSGDRMNNPDSVPLPPLQPGEQDNIMLNLTAPETLGMVRSTWMAQDPQGKTFQYEIFALINVQPSGEVNMAARFEAPMSVHYVQGPGYNAPLWYGVHRGIDYDVPVGTPLFAGGVGRVYKTYFCPKCDGKSFAELGLSADVQKRALSDFSLGYNYGFGNLVVIRYAWNDLPEGARQAMQAANFTSWYAYVYYAHLNEIRVNEGDIVQKGSLLGFSGETGNTSGAHLHLEIHCYANPKARLFTQPANLLDPATVFVY